MASNTTKPKEDTWAASPFGRNDAGDIIVRSSDSVKFSLHKLLLSIASPVFSDMFSLGNGATVDEKSDKGVPIVSVSEHSETLDPFFKLLYPLRKPSVGTLTKIAALLEAGRKYQAVGVIDPMATALHAHTTTDSRRVFAIACRFGMEAEARLAAESAVKWDYEERTKLKYIPEMEHITAGAYFRLLYHLRTRSGPLLANHWDSLSFIDRNTADGLTLTTTNEKAPTWAPSQAFLAGLPHIVWNHYAIFKTNRYDVVLRSADGSSFSAHKIVLSVASAPLGSAIRELSTNGYLDITESPRATFLLLQCCYGFPLVDPTITADGARLSDLHEKMILAQKYRLSNVVAEARCLFREFCKSNPLRSYFIAHRIGWSDEQKLAAKHAVSDAGLNILNSYVQEMEFSPAWVYFNLLQYEEAARAASRAVTIRYSSRTLEDICYDDQRYWGRSLTVKATVSDPATAKKIFPIVSREISLYSNRQCTPHSGNLFYESQLMEDALETALSEVYC